MTYAYVLVLVLVLFAGFFLTTGAVVLRSLTGVLVNWAECSHGMSRGSTLLATSFPRSWKCGFVCTRHMPSWTLSPHASSNLARESRGNWTSRTSCTDVSQRIGICALKTAGLSFLQTNSMYFCGFSERSLSLRTMSLNPRITDLSCSSGSDFISCSSFHFFNTFSSKSSSTSFCSLTCGQYLPSFVNGFSKMGL